MKSDVKSFTATGTKQYQLTVQAATGGTVNTNASGKYAANTAVSLVATPNSGYEFAGWASSNGGSFTSVASASTSFTMPAANTTLTAHFKEKITPNTSISAAPQNLDFGSQTEGYAAPAAQTVTITNNGNQTVRLEQPVANNYTIGVLSATTLAPNETATFAISPKTGLSVGTYNESIGVSAFGDVSSAGLAIKLNFAVTEKPVTPSYTITAAPAALDFGTVTEGYAAPAAKTVTVTNTGNQTITLNQPTSSSYTISALSSTSLAPNGTATFTVTPKTGLAVGNCNETITISTTDNTSATVSASLTVQAKPVTPTYTITAAPAALDFGTVTEGYAAPAAKTVTVTNTGNQTVTLNQPTSSSYTISALSSTSLAPNGTATFTVTPKTGLAVGNSNETITISTTDNTSATVSASLTVQAKPVTPSYTITAAPAALDFGTVTEGYAAPAAKTVTVTNTGNQTITLNQPTSSSYTIGALSSTSLAPNGTATFTVTPKTGLAVGNYTEDIVIASDKTESVEVQVKLAVQAVPTRAFSLSTNEIDFGSMMVGYQGKTVFVTIKNTGNQTITLSQPTAEKFTVGAMNVLTLQPNATASFPVMLTEGMKPGQYTEKIIVSAGDLQEVLLLKAVVTAQTTAVPVPDVPQTGDETPLMLLLAFMLASGFGVMLISTRRRQTH